MVLINNPKAGKSVTAVVDDLDVCGDELIVVTVIARTSTVDGYIILAIQVQGLIKSNCIYHAALFLTIFSIVRLK